MKISGMTQSCYIIEKRLFGVKLRIHFLFPFFILALFITDPEYSPLAIICAALHELGHILAAAAFKVKISELCLLPFGASLLMSGVVPYKAELAVCLAGPVANIAFGGIFWWLAVIFSSKQLLFCCFCSLCLATINLLPSTGFDGGAAIKCLAFCLFEYQKALTAIRLSELCSIVILCLFLSRVVILCGFNLTILAISIYAFSQAVSRCDLSF